MKKIAFILLLMFVSCSDNNPLSSNEKITSDSVIVEYTFSGLPPLLAHYPGIDKAVNETLGSNSNGKIVEFTKIVTYKKGFSSTYRVKLECGIQAPLSIKVVAKADDFTYIHESTSSNKSILEVFVSLPF